jgi:hypothetical protein
MGGLEGYAGDPPRRPRSGAAWHPGGPGAAGRERPSGEGRGGMAMYEAYCVKCRTKRQFEGQEVTLKNGRKAAQGTCPVCGTKVMRILGKAS